MTQHGAVQIHSSLLSSEMFLITVLTLRHSITKLDFRSNLISQCLL